MSSPEIETRLRDALAARPEVLEAYVFGSTARGEASAHSDVDVAVYVDESRIRPSAFGYAADLTADLMSVLGSSKIDVVVLNHAGPLLYHRVLRDGIRIHAVDLRAATTREGYALSRYCDYIPTLRKLEQQLGRRIETGEFGR